ncbi:MAG: hypothetical protein M0Z95_08005 [Actinomycetota bacterium]|nr:hypothetical protein [Actinomycetota bacterium]
MSLSQWDDFPVHQAPELIRHPATSDRNFYDRYYFNMHPCAGDWFAIFGFGQYPNLGVVDAFVDVRRGGSQYIVRASAPLGDRRDTSVGPFLVEVVEPLQTLRIAVDEAWSTLAGGTASRAGPPRVTDASEAQSDDLPVSMDVTWTGHTPAIAEPRQFIRSREKVVFDTQRLVQTGTWSGTLVVAGEEITVSPEHCWGNRDRSWGIRPVGEPEPGGIREGELVLPGMWNYFPMQFADHAVFYICHETDDGTRPLFQAERVWCDPARPHDDLGPVEHAHRFEPGTRVVRGSLLRFPESGIEIECVPLLTNFVSVGTGYGIDADWRHGMYHGPDPVVQGLVLGVDDVRGIGQYGIVDHLATFSYGDNVGYGLLEQGFFGPVHRYGMTDALMGAPGS